MESSSDGRLRVAAAQCLSMPEHYAGFNTQAETNTTVLNLRGSRALKPLQNIHIFSRGRTRRYADNEKKEIRPRLASAFSFNICQRSAGDGSRGFLFFLPSAVESEKTCLRLSVRTLYPLRVSRDRAEKMLLCVSLSIRAGVGGAI